MDMRLQRGRNCVYKRRHVLGYRDRILLKPMQLRATLLLDSRVVCSNMVREAAPTWSEKRTSVFRPLKKKGFKEERVTTIGLDDIGTSTTLESNKSLWNLTRIVLAPFHSSFSRLRPSSGKPILLSWPVCHVPAAGTGCQRSGVFYSTTTGSYSGATANCLASARRRVSN